jgi:hypothetical protein
MVLNELQDDEIKNDNFEYLIEQKDWNGAVKELCTSTTATANDNVCTTNIGCPMEDWQTLVILDLLYWLKHEELPEILFEKILRTIRNKQLGRKGAANCLDLSDFQRITLDDVRIAVIRFINMFVSAEISTDAESIEWAIMIHNYMNENAMYHEEMFVTNERKGLRRLDKFWQDIVYASVLLANSTESCMECSIEPSEHDVCTDDSIPSIKEENTNDHDKTSNDYVEKVAIASDFISDNIFKGAVLVSDGLANVIVPNVTKGIEAIGDFVIRQNSNPSIPAVKRKTENHGTATKTKEEQELEELVSWTKDSAKASDSIRQGVRTLTYGIRDYSTRQIHTASRAWQEKQIGKQVIQDENIRESLVATGKVGVATIGASALLVESIFDTTKAIAQTSVKVAAKVGAHYHGEEVGNVIDNVGVTAGNVLRTVAHVGTLEAQVLSKAVARNSAKVEMKAKIKESVDKDVEITQDEQRLRDLMNTAKETITSYGEKIPLGVMVDKVKSLDSKVIVDGNSSSSISKE